MVECKLPKLDVAGSIPVSRSEPKEEASEFRSSPFRQGEVAGLFRRQFRSAAAAGNHKKSRSAFRTESERGSSAFQSFASEFRHR